MSLGRIRMPAPTMNTEVANERSHSRSRDFKAGCVSLTSRGLNSVAFNESSPDSTISSKLHNRRSVDRYRQCILRITRGIIQNKLGLSSQIIAMCSGAETRVLTLPISARCPQPHSSPSVLTGIYGTCSNTLTIAQNAIRNGWLLGR